MIEKRIDSNNCSVLLIRELKKNYKNPITADPYLFM